MNNNETINAKKVIQHPNILPTFLSLPPLVNGIPIFLEILFFIPETPIALFQDQENPNLPIALFCKIINKFF